MKRKSTAEERGVIVDQPHKRPYGIRVRIHVQHAGALGRIEEVSIPLKSGAFIAIAHGRMAPGEGGKKYVLTLAGFSTAASAEVAGQRLVQALLWMAVSTDAPLRLEYRSYAPAAVFDRNQAIGITSEATAEVSFSPAVVLGELQDAYERSSGVDEKLQLSMEIFCGARLESSQRATFLLLVSALEPLARPTPLHETVGAFIEECVRRLKSNEAIDPDVRSSLEGRLLHLKHESIRQALRRLVQGVLPGNAEAAQIIDDAYSLRSQLIHSGVPADLDVDLERESIAVARVIRSLYAAAFQRKLARAG